MLRLWLEGCEPSALIGRELLGGSCVPGGQLWSGPATDRRQEEERWGSWTTALQADFPWDDFWNGRWEGVHFSWDYQSGPEEGGRAWLRVSNTDSQSWVWGQVQHHAALLLLQGAQAEKRQAGGRWLWKWWGIFTSRSSGKTGEILNFCALKFSIWREIIWREYARQDIKSRLTNNVLSLCGVVSLITEQKTNYKKCSSAKLLQFHSAFWGIHEWMNSNWSCQNNFNWKSRELGRHHQIWRHGTCPQ